MASYSYPAGFSTIRQSLRIPSRNRCGVDATNIPYQIMTTDSRDSSNALPHSCIHCGDFVIHLFDEPGKDRTDSPVWHSPNASQQRLAARLYGDDFWSDVWTEYREYFFRRTDGFSYFDASKADLARFSADGCLLSRRLLDSLRDDELPKHYALGALMLTTYSLEFRALNLQELTSEMLLASDDSEDADNTFTVLAEQGSAAAEVIDNFPVNTKPNSDETLLKASDWLQECMEQHCTCRKPDPSFNPTRLIRVQSQNNEVHCQLQEMSQAPSEPYAALSYCWGGNQKFKTTEKLLPQYLEELDTSRLPQTLLDAILVAVRLGLQYIWIDALCIIQDSAADKAVEIDRMARVYGNATITIAATRASAVWDGFLSERKSLTARSSNRCFALPCRQKDLDLGTLILLPFTHESTEPLDTRGWTFQERVLSPRVLDFGAMRTQYTCQTSLGQVPSDGWSNLPMHRAYGSGLDSQIISDLISGLYPADEMLHYWLKVVEGFTSRGLSFTTDKLPAIAGMAECFGTLMNDEYCAGLWRKGMPQSLLWKAGNRMQHINRDFETRRSRESVAAPSWSWAAVNRAVTFENLFSTNTHVKLSFMVKIEHCAVHLQDDRTPYGAVKYGALNLQCYARQAKWAKANIYKDPEMLLVADDETERPPRALLGGFRASDSTGIHFVPDAIEDEFRNSASCCLDVYLLLFGIHQPALETGLNCSIFGLVIRQVRHDRTKFSRVGFFQRTQSRADNKDYVDWFKNKGKGSFILI